MKRAGGFSLIEVALALGIIAVGIVSILGLLPALTRQSAEAAETRVALGLADAVRVALDERAAGGFDALASSLPVRSTDPTAGLLLVAARDGGELRWLDAAETPVRDQYYLLVVRRYATSPLAYETGSGWLAAEVLVAWPYRSLTPAGLTPATLPGDRSTITFSVVLNR